MNKTMNRIKAAASAVVLCLLATGTALAEDTPKPYVTFTIKNADGVFTNEASFVAAAELPDYRPSHDNYKTPITVMRVTLSQAYNDTHKIYFAASTNGNWACVQPGTWQTDPYRDYDIDTGDLIGLSTSNGGTAYDEKIRFVEFGAGETEKDVYIYGLKGNADSEKYGIKFFPYPQYSSDFYKFGKHQGVTLYLSPVPRKITPQPVTDATVKVYTNDTVEVVGQGNPPAYSVRPNAQVKVVYTANTGYVFPDGQTEWTTNFTANACEMAVTIPADQWPVPQTKFAVTAPEGASAAVYTKAVEPANLVPAGGKVWSNCTAFVVYTVTEEGKFFENGEKEVVNRLDTANDPAKDTSAYVPKAVGVPSVSLGVVAQRYPWNGIMDIQYKTPYANAATIVTFKANGTTIGTAKGTGGQVATASIDLNTAADGAFKGKALKNVKITATIE